MRSILIFVFSCCFVSCQSQEARNILLKNKSNFDKITEYIDTNYSILQSSDCTEKYGIIISDGSINIRNCFPSLKKDLSVFLELKLFNNINVMSRSDVLFELDFVEDEIEMTEIKKYLLYFEADELPDHYQSWIGIKEKINKNWWYLEYTNSKY